MPNTNALPSERFSVLAVINPQASSSAVSLSAYVPVSNYNTLLAGVHIGQLNTTGSTAAASTSGTVDFQLYQATTSSGKSSKALGTAMSTLTITTTSVGTSSITMQNVREDVMDVANGFDFVGMTVTPGDSVYFSAELLGFDHRHAPGSDHNIAAVAEILSS